MAFAYSLRVLIPSLIWSAVFHGFFLCIDPLFFVLFEGRIKSSAIKILKTLWCMLFIISLLAGWNILPLSYSFYLDVVSQSSPAMVVLGLACLLLLLAVYVFSGSAKPASPASRHFQLIAGSGLLILKLILVLGAPTSNSWRQALVTPAHQSAKVITQSISGGEHGSSGPITGPTFFSFIRRQPAPPPKVVLMLVESWGESAVSLRQIANGLREHRIEIVEAGFSDYQGATLQGEFRELCSQNIPLRGDLLLSDLKSECAPAYFARKGYRVVGMHGFKKEFYSRDLIWKKLGTQERYFYDSLKELERCFGPFTGVCDNDLIRHGTRLVSGAEKTFLYLLTLSSHEPLPSQLVPPDTRYFANIDTVTSTQVVTRNAITSLVAALDNESHGQCTVAYVVGDHQPPSAVAAGLFEPSKVPFLVMSFHCDSPKHALGLRTRDLPAHSF